MNKEGIKTRTDVAYLYIDGLVDVDVLHDFETRMHTLPEAEILSERNLVELLYGKTWNPYPHVAIASARTSVQSTCCRDIWLHWLIILLPV